MGTFGNVLTTILLTLTCSLILIITYRYALRPILLKHNIIPLQNLPNPFSRNRHVRLPVDDDWDDSDGEDPDFLPQHSSQLGRGRRDLEGGFRDDSDDEDEPESSSRRSEVISRGRI
ncbi:hypothetical protein RUND412_006269 [Rhizina undulata]